MMGPADACEPSRACMRLTNTTGSMLKAYATIGTVFMLQYMTPQTISP